MVFLKYLFLIRKNIVKDILYYFTKDQSPRNSRIPILCSSSFKIQRLLIKKIENMSGKYVMTSISFIHYFIAHISNNVIHLFLCNFNGKVIFI